MFPIDFLVTLSKAKLLVFISAFSARNILGTIYLINTKLRECIILCTCIYATRLHQLYIFVAQTFPVLFFHYIYYREDWTDINFRYILRIFVQGMKQNGTRGHLFLTVQMKIVLMPAFQTTISLS